MPHQPSPVAAFAEIAAMIQAARVATHRAVNTALIDLYRRVGGYISQKVESAVWGQRVVTQLAEYLAREHPDLKGFTRRNLFRMKQFHEAYRGGEIVPPLVALLSWSHHLLILGRAERLEEREFYVRLAVRERWSRRELDRQMNSLLFARSTVDPPKTFAALRAQHPEIDQIVRDQYVVDFLNLPDAHAEADLHRALVALELKATEFEPARLGQLEFYLEALDRDVRKPHERPSIGVLLCTSRTAEVVEYALARTTSPAPVAEYVGQLPGKQLLEAKLREFYALVRDESRDG